MEVKEEQPEKIPASIEVTPAGISMEVKEEQPEKAYLPIDLRLLPGL